jgi:hypothetical protein
VGEGDREAVEGAIRFTRCQMPPPVRSLSSRRPSAGPGGTTSEIFPGAGRKAGRFEKREVGNFAPPKRQVRRQFSECRPALLGGSGLYGEIPCFREFLREFCKKLAPSRAQFRFPRRAKHREENFQTKSSLVQGEKQGRIKKWGPNFVCLPRGATAKRGRCRAAAEGAVRSSRPIAPSAEFILAPAFGRTRGHHLPCTVHVRGRKAPVQKIPWCREKSREFCKKLAPAFDFLPRAERVGEGDREAVEGAIRFRRSGAPSGAEFILAPALRPVAGAPPPPRNACAGEENRGAVLRSERMRPCAVRELWTYREIPCSGNFSGNFKNNWGGLACVFQSFSAAGSGYPPARE